jgi:hypothetical protein
VSGSSLKEEIARKSGAYVSLVHGRAAMRDEFPNYVRSLEHNLAPGIPLTSVAEDFRAADGRELVSTGGRPGKLHAVHSSSALAVNTFGSFRDAPGRLRIAGRGGFGYACFEKKLRTGLGGTPPNLDFFAVGDEAVVAVEAKFTEVLGAKLAGFSESYSGLVSELAGPRWREMYASLCDDPKRFRHLDAAQLVKHYLGIRHSLADEPQPKLLVYLFWEPANWDRVGAFTRHRAEALEFSMSVAGGETEFIAMSFAELWEEWSREGLWEGAEERREYLRERYVFTLTE